VSFAEAFRDKVVDPGGSVNVRPKRRIDSYLKVVVLGVVIGGGRCK
jgi:hypothetical protein